MKGFRVLLLTAIWCVLTRELSLANVLLGSVVGGLLVHATSRSASGAGQGSVVPASVQVLWRKALVRPFQALELGIFFLIELLLSNLRIAALMVRPKVELRPMIIAIPVEAESEEELAVLSDLLTLTPGTLSLDVGDDARTLVVHALSAEDPDEIRRLVRDGLGRRVRRLFA